MGDYIAQASFGADASVEEIQEFYKKWSVTYDKDLKPDSNWPCVANVAKTFSKIVGEAGKSLRIVDLGAGTGMVATELKKYGFVNIDALDASQEMLEKAQEKQLYKQYICDVVTADRPLEIATGTYDALISCGTITGGYVKANALNEVLRLVKPGGIICFTIRKNVYEENEFGYAEMFKELVNLGKWEEIGRELSDYCKDSIEIQKQCFIFCYKVLKNE